MARERDEMDAIDSGSTPHIVNLDGETHGQRLVREMRSRATTKMTTDELMALLRGE